MRGVDGLQRHRSIRDGQGTGILQDHDIGVGDHGQAFDSRRCQVESPGDLVAVGRASVERGHVADGDALFLEVVEHIGATAADSVDDEIGRADTHHPRQAGIPTEGFEMETGRRVHDAGEGASGGDNRGGSTSGGDVGHGTPDRAGRHVGRR